jgi:hypothetical protein
MWKQLKKGVARVGGLILALAGGLPDNGWTFMGQVVNRASSSPLRTALVIVGIALILYSFKDQVLNALGIRTLKRLESDVRSWLDAFGYSVKREADDATNFKFTATPELGHPVTIVNAKHREQYVMMGAFIGLSKREKAFFDSLTLGERSSIESNLALVLSQARASFSVVPPDNVIVIECLVPITPNLTEHVFMTAMDDINRARYGVINALHLMLGEAHRRRGGAARAGANIVVRPEVTETKDDEKGTG